MIATGLKGQAMSMRMIDFILFKCRVVPTPQGHKLAGPEWLKLRLIELGLDIENAFAVK